MWRLVSSLLMLSLVCSNAEDTTSATSPVEGVDSDYLYLFMAKSTIPLDVGYGVFAKMDIPAGNFYALNLIVWH